MATYTRPAKAVSGDGSTSYVDGNKLPASELNADIDGIVNVLNGNIDSNNISSSANIPNSALVEIDGTKVADHANDDSTFLTATSRATVSQLADPRISRASLNAFATASRRTTGTSRSRRQPTPLTL